MHDRIHMELYRQRLAELVRRAERDRHLAPARRRSPRRPAPPRDDG
jgi:hypothetical protein